MADSLDVARLLGDLPSREFEPRPFYLKDADTIEWHFTPEDFYAERVDSWLTIYKSFETDQMVGFKLKNVRTLVQCIETLGLRVRTSPEAWEIHLDASIALTPTVTSMSSAPYLDLLKIMPQQDRLVGIG